MLMLIVVKLFAGRVFASGFKTIQVGNYTDDVGFLEGHHSNMRCSHEWMTSSPAAGRYMFVCDEGPIWGRYVSISFHAPDYEQLEICDVVLY